MTKKKKTQRVQRIKNEYLIKKKCRNAFSWKQQLTYLLDRRFNIVASRRYNRESYRRNVRPLVGFTTRQ